jgi:hypothetical protein
MFRGELLLSPNIVYNFGYLAGFLSGVGTYRGMPNIREFDMKSKTALKRKRSEGVESSSSNSISASLANLLKLLPQDFI